MPEKKEKFNSYEKKYFSTQEVADITGLTQTTLTLWLRNKIIDDSKIRRDPDGRRLWTREDIEMIQKIKKQEGWS
ncbi:MerR family transcriptional regulator [Candidatus Sumerlaeota bacterium]|nr:MerR family transcriptional regulator [Candidatus Sumerlaeota bacterium]